MAPGQADRWLAHAAELERRDEAIAGELEAIRQLEERTGAVRARAARIGAFLERLPLELGELEARRRDADAGTATARAELERADARAADLASGRRRRVEELERARKEAATAREALADALARRARVDEREAALREEEHASVAEAAELGRLAARIAADVRSAGRLAEAAGRDPGTTLAAIEDWAGQVRSALLVARGTLEAERERIVAEANGLGTSVLGEELGASSVALVRRRLEERLDVDS